MEELVPKDHAEEIAVWRSQVIAPLVVEKLERGKLTEKMEELSKKRYRRPGEQDTCGVSVPTLERWYYRWKNGGLEALRPQMRSDRGRAQALSEELRALVLDVRRAHPSASAKLILRTLVAQGRLRQGLVSESTLRRLFAQQGLDRVSQRRSPGTTERLRWEAEFAGALWHGDVCHGPVLGGGTRWQRLRIHGLLDDRSRFVVALEARDAEREDDMLAVLVAAVRRHGLPDALYLDNGSTYSGLTLATACARLGISLLHARPYDPEARGKMERFWRTLREAMLDHLNRDLSLAEVQARLDTFLSRHYHSQPHASLFGETPEQVWQSHRTRTVEPERLAEALTVRTRRLVSRDGVVSVEGRLFELRQSFLCGRRLRVSHCLVDGLPEDVHVEHDGRRYELHPLDTQANARKPRRPRQEPVPASIPFDPADPKLP